MLARQRAPKLTRTEGQNTNARPPHRSRVMMILLESEHSPWSRAELEREIAGVKGDPLDVTDAVNRLYASGLVHLSGELVTPTRAACLMDELRL
jgi:hypothetical protein